MPMVATDIKIYYSGGAANSDPNASLGGVISSVEVSAGVHNLFDQVASDEASAGDTEYRCEYVKNTHPTLTAQNLKVFVNAESPSADTDEEIGLGTSAINGTEQTIADEDTAPSGVSFAQANGVGAALVIGDLAPGETKAYWVKRTVSPGAAAYNNDGPTIRFAWDTAA
ncbi:hypothetical protein FHP88_15685 [Sedimenticola selenatireducens]|uniref:Uncharacterized protein n=1 Tax=Sedimenticola selenatireducens TaxID=191960 RepID=A0A557S0F3_9GAMM|nr:hypothetical protein FHP88_15685 [Sedimenticola selenatireducens]